MFANCAAYLVGSSLATCSLVLRCSLLVASLRCLFLALVLGISSLKKPPSVFSLGTWDQFAEETAKRPRSVLGISSAEDTAVIGTREQFAAFTAELG